MHHLAQMAAKDDGLKDTKETQATDLAKRDTCIAELKVFLPANDTQLASLLAQNQELRQDLLAAREWADTLNMENDELMIKLDDYVEDE